MQPDSKNRAPTAQKTEGDNQDPLGTWLKLSQDAYQGSTDYWDSNYRKVWEDSLRAFNNMHPTDSKYSQPSYEKRSRIYRPRTRAVIRKNEAAAAAAFFSNMDVVSVTAQDPTSKNENASADVMKELLQYRLNKSIPWYQVVLGGLQDAQTVGVACAHIYWDYQEIPQVTEEAVEVKPELAADQDAADEFPDQNPESIPLGALIANSEGGLNEAQTPIKEITAAEVIEPIVKVDKPVVDLFPVENIRFDPSANWVDVVSSSPYLIHLIPMYVLDVKEKMESGEWFPHGDDKIATASEGSIDTTRVARNRGSDDPMKSGATEVGDYQITWVHRHIPRRNGEDWEWYTLGTVAMLTEPQALTEVVFHGKRPYVIGPCILETHKPMPTTIPQLGRGLQDEINEVANQRIDNVKFVLNKKWFVKRGKEADLMGLVRNVPGGVVMLDDPQNDVREVTWPDVTASAFQEHQTLNTEFDELLGNFNPASIMQNGGGNSPARNMAMLANSQGTLVEYMLRTYVETFVQPVLRQLVMLEQEYETDQVVMKIAGKRAKVFQKYGIDEVTDQLLENELTLTVNVGMGATDPMQKLQKFIAAMGAYTNMLVKPPPGINMQEVGKEIFGHLGYSDGSRFFTNDNPQIQQMQQQMQQMQGIIQQLTQKVQDKQTAHQVKVKVAAEKNQSDMKRTVIHEENENKRALATHFRALLEGEQKKVPVPGIMKPAGGV